jgi:Zn-dependent protease with chaperone function
VVHLCERFERLYRAYVLKAESPDQELSQVAMTGIEGYFRSHPLLEERVNQIERLIAAKK